MIGKFSCGNVVATPETVLPEEYTKNREIFPTRSKVILYNENAVNVVGRISNSHRKNTRIESHFGQREKSTFIFRRYLPAVGTTMATI